MPIKFYFDRRTDIMDKELQKLIEDFNKKLDDAQAARSEVMDYLEEKYGIDTTYESETLEDECNWCYGINMEGIDNLIGK